MEKLKQISMTTLAFLLAASVLTFIGCSKDDGPGEDDSDYVVYAAGSYSEGSVSTACYWKNGKRQSLSAPAGSVSYAASEIVVEGGSVFVLGNFRDSDSNTQYVYWKNGAITYLSIPAGAHYNVNSTVTFAVDKGNVYVAGAYSDFDGNAAVCYWIDGVRTDLTDIPVDAKNPFAVSVAVYNDKVYIAGSYDNASFETQICYWIDGVRTDLTDIPASDYIFPQSIAVYDGNLYLSCMYGAGFDVYYSYFSGSAWTTFQVPAGKVSQEINGRLVVDDGNVYAAGSLMDGTTQSPVACYWKDETCTLLTNTGSYVSTAVYLHDGSVYVSGTEIVEAGFNSACYWVDGVFKELSSPSGSDGAANSIFVMDK